jgi:hypothetical protein
MMFDNPLIAAHKIPPETLLEVMRTGIKGLHLKEGLAGLVEHYLFSAIGKADIPIKFSDFGTPERLAAVAGIAGWRAREENFDRVSARAFCMFQILLLEYHGLKMPAMQPIEDGQDDIIILQIPRMAEETGMLRAMYSADARLENGNVSIPLRDATSKYAAADVFIRSKRVYIPARIFGHYFGIYSKQVFNALVKIGAPRRIILTGIDDFSKLMEFPCFSRAMKEKSLPHQVRAAMFSTLLWFYDVDQCVEIIEKKIGVPNFDRERTVYQLNSLLETDPLGKSEPKYCYGVNGFAPYCVGYENCKRCWLRGLKLPDRYFEKKKEIMDTTNQTECKFST